MREFGFNDIRTTLQALYAINDNCNSLHTNAAVNLQYAFYARSQVNRHPGRQFCR